jgi:biotin transport system substrate-specific component
MISSRTLQNKLTAIRFSYFAWSRTDNWVQGLFLACAFAALTGLLAQIRVYLPFTPVPITGQTLGVLLAGALLGARFGTFSMGLYLLLGLVGVPWFAGGDSGFAYILGPTGGYLLGFIVASWLIGIATDSSAKMRKPALQAALMVAGMTVIYAFGASWLMLGSHCSLSLALGLGVIPFLLGDALKIMLAASIGALLLPGPSR